MISVCTHCGQELNLTEAQQQKIKTALAALSPGKSLKFNCPHCLKAIEVKQAESESAEKKQQVSKAINRTGKGKIDPPAPPDMGWLERGDLGKGEVVEDVPQVLILIPEGEIQEAVMQLFDALGYKAVLPHSASEAIDVIRFTEFSAVVLYSLYEGSLAASSFHAYMKEMPMTRRRYIYYVLIGPEFHSMYNLEALSLSANIVVNEKEMSAFPLIMKKGFRDYDELFGPYLKALAAVGKR